MNIEAMVTVLAVASGFVTFITAVGNPWFENKQILRITIISFGVTVLMALILAGMS